MDFSSFTAGKSPPGERYEVYCAASPTPMPERNGSTGSRSATTQALGAQVGAPRPRRRHQPPGGNPSLRPASATAPEEAQAGAEGPEDRKSTRLNSSH